VGSKPIAQGIRNSWAGETVLALKRGDAGADATKTFGPAGEGSMKRIFLKNGNRFVTRGKK